MTVTIKARVIRPKPPTVYAVDFDGTLCENAYPLCGKPNMALITFLKQRRAAGDKLILWTCRSGKLLTDAVMWCGQFGLWFDARNENLPERIAQYGNDSRKVSADWYIDDRNLKLWELC